MVGHLVDDRHVRRFSNACCGAPKRPRRWPKSTRPSERIEAARAAAEDNPARAALVDMLSAELAIRRLRFDEARSILEKVIGSGQSVATLRGRAQWMIGETYFLQQKFADAIEAYRRVEGIDPAGPWVEVALAASRQIVRTIGSDT